MRLKGETGRHPVYEPDQLRGRLVGPTDRRPSVQAIIMFGWRAMIRVRLRSLK
jgi:hypothetical protein